MHPFQHLRNLRRHGLMHRRRRMQRVVPEILLQLHATNLVEIILLARRLVLLAVVRRVLINRRLRVGFGILDDFGEKGVRVELEDCHVRVCVRQVGGEVGEAHVPVRDGAGRDRVAPFAREGHQVQGRDVENEEVAGAGEIELGEGEV